MEKSATTSQLDLPHHERIEDKVFRHAVELIDKGDAAALNAFLREHPDLAHARVEFGGDGYFRNPTLLAFIAENPVRHGKLPGNILEVAGAILDAGADRRSMDETLGLVATGRVSRECGAQCELINLLCDRGADADAALFPAAAHGEIEAVRALIARGATMSLPVAAALGSDEDFQRLFPDSGGEDRHRALALASQFGRTDMVRLLLDAGEDPNRYNPAGAHSQSTPLHQAAWAGHSGVVSLLVERGANLRMKDLLWNGTAADWAHHAQKPELESYLRGLEALPEKHQ